MANFTDNGIAPEKRANYYVGDTCDMKIDGKMYNDSRYIIDEFSEKYGMFWLLETK